MTASMILTKGHGTENDFVLLPDPDAVVSLSPELVRGLCDRRSGIGADGLMRIVRTKLATEPDVRAQADVAEYFMDYHNADGSIAEMCGNGIRVFARYLLQASLIAGPTTIATRGGPREVAFVGQDVSVVMGAARLRAEKPVVRLSEWKTALPGIALDMPNPHVVVRLEDAQELATMDLSTAPHVSPRLPDGQNVEFVAVTGDKRMTMRVHERGVGETRSCGTGVCAAVAAVSKPDDEGPWQVDVPGGSCSVARDPDGQLILIGPAVLVADFTVRADWLAAHR